MNKTQNQTEISETKKVSKPKKINIKILISCAMLVALSIIFGKYLAIKGGNVLRFSLENTPIILAGVAFGPIAGTLTAVVADLVGCLMVGYPINPIVTIGAAVIGLLSGLIYKYSEKLPFKLRLILCVFISHLIGSVIIKTFGLAKFYEMPFITLTLWRLLNYAIIGVLDFIIVFYLIKNKTISAQIDSIKRSNVRATMNYNEALEYVHSVNWEFCKPGLERIELLCNKLSNPQNKLKFIHVAGTNGKGSFCSMLSSVLISEGYRVGVFTSPYILNFNERMSINGENISNEEFAKIASYVRPICDAMEDKPTEFELITAIAFEYFARHCCDYVVLECGLGGRLDSTNIISTSILSVIVGIALDHTAILGDTIEKIAFEKAGIIKKNVPCLFCGDDNSALEVIKNKASEMSSPFYTVNHKNRIIKSATLDGTVFDFGKYKDVKIKLLGAYQPFNASNVLCAIDILKEYGFNISDEAIYKGLENATWRARFEIISKSPLVIADGGHNPEGIDSAVLSIKHYFPDKKVYIITGVMKDKDYGYMAKRISEVAKEVFCLTPENPRALDSAEYAKVFSNLGVISSSYNAVKDAVFASMEKANDTPIIALGSLYMYGDVLKSVNEYNKKEI